MPWYNFATYADAREEWAIQADSLEHARELIGDDPDGRWIDAAILLDSYEVERREEFVTEEADDETPDVEEITPDHWAWNAAHREWLERSLRENIAAISAEFHTHRLYAAFYEAFGRRIAGFVGQYDLCIAMAEALTAWESANGVAEAYENLGVPWIEIVEGFVEHMLKAATESDELPDPAQTLSGIRVLAGRQA